MMARKRYKSIRASRAGTYFYLYFVAGSKPMPLSAKGSRGTYRSYIGSPSRSCSNVSVSY